MKKDVPFIFLFLLPLLAHAGLVWERTEIDRPATLEQEEMVAVFPFRNEGESSVTIINLSSSCGCTVPELEKREYAPGESGEIRAVFKFGSREGVQRKRISVTSVDEDGGRSLHHLQLRTEIPAWGSMQPRLLRWTLDSEGEAKELTLRIADPERIAGPELVSPPRHFVLEEISSVKGEHTYRIRPVDTKTRQTERIAFQLAVKGDGRVHTRQMAFHCLVR